ncbi:putative nucleotidyltransferase [Candidatus Electrothrix marina]|uniref:Putative nucleotidyltransferase n=1 Tax=Candidatus Electrothrix marina TaxID=1859130 RepID=A0A444JDL7_9BACT|nr:putative nucleotidyltransferase [Candidatus Electrothrix marina]
MHPFLRLCARIEPHPLQQEMLAQACSGFQAWDGLLQQAEVHGMAPLLLRHLLLAEIHLPDHIFRSLRLLAIRHRQSNALLSKTLARVLNILESAGIPSLVLKGAALCKTLYPEPGLRPMRDMVIVVKNSRTLIAALYRKTH